MTLNNALRCVIFASMLAETQHDTRIDSDPILAFLCIAFLHQVVKKPPTFLVINLCVSRINVTQILASLCELALSEHVHECKCLQACVCAYAYKCVCVHVHVLIQATVSI